METKITLEDHITAMLKENTGTHFLDSGGAYGRHWEKNQKRDFKKEPACWFEAHTYRDNVPELEISYNLWHYLVNFLEYDDACEKLNKELQEFANLPQWEKETWEDTLNAWVKTQEFTDLWSEYTYNVETLLDQDIVYTHFDYEGDNYIFLRVHGGCDARGGFSDPVIFKVPDMDYFLIGQRDCYLYADNPLDKNQTILEGIEPPKESYAWDSDEAGYHFYPANNEPELDTVLEVHDDKAYINIGGKLLELTASVMESY